MSKQSTAENSAKNYNSGEDTLGGRIQTAREARGLSVSQASRRIGVLSKTLASWESDSSEPRVNKMQMLAGVLKVPPLWLLGGNRYVQNDDPATQVDETADLERRLEKLVDMHGEMATLIFEMQSELTRLQSKFNHINNAV